MIEIHSGESNTASHESDRTYRSSRRRPQRSAGRPGDRPERTAARAESNAATTPARVQSRSEKFALTGVSASGVNVQVVPVPPHAPPHARRPGVAVSTIRSPGLTDAVQASPQLIPPTSLVTVPSPVTLTVTSTVGAGTKLAATVRSAVIVTLHPPVPVQSPPQRPNT